MKKIMKLFQEQKADIIKLVVFTITLGVAINLFSSGLSSVFHWSNCANLIIGFIMIIAIITSVCFYVTHKLKTTISFDGSFVIDTDKQEKLVTIPGYPISLDMSRYFYAASKENAAISNQWVNVSFRHALDNKGENENQKSYEIVNELIEYCVLDNLSTFVTDHFNGLDKLHIAQKVRRQDLPDIFLSNRFLRLFSEQIDNRTAFDDRSMCVIAKDDEGNEEIVYMMGKDGQIYNHFDLYMPKGTTVRREKEAIQIDTKLFVLELTCKFEGYCSNFSKAFYMFYMGATNTDILSAYKFTIKLDVRYKPFSMFKIKDWKDFDWLDGYISRLQHYCDKDTFLEDIAWEKQEANLRIMRNIPRFMRKSAVESKENDA